MVRTSPQLIGAMLVLIAATPAARADFSFGRPPPSVQSAPSAEMPAQLDHALFRLASGFGDGVPLAFAARQIVPRSVQLRFGAGVNRASFVSWRGGAAWNRVLADAVRPLGLRVLTGVSTVTILR